MLGLLVEDLGIGDEAVEPAIEAKDEPVVWLVESGGTWLNARGPSCRGRGRTGLPATREASDLSGLRSGPRRGATCLQVCGGGPWGGTLMEAHGGSAQL